MRLCKPRCRLDLRRGISVAILAVSFVVMTSPGQEKPTTSIFEVASVKASNLAALTGGIEFSAGGRFRAKNVMLTIIIQRAFDVRDYQLQGAPSWIKERYEIDAKAPEGFSGEKQLRPMLQNLLAERFQMRFHHESKLLSVYVLSVDKKGSRLSDGREEDAPSPTKLFVGRGSITAKSAPLSLFVTPLSRLLRSPVLDETGLAGKYDFILHYDPGSAQMPFSSPAVAKPPEAESSEPSIFTALQEQLGLRMDSKKRQVDVIVIDSIQRPSPN